MTTPRRSLRFEILGPLQAWVGDRRVDLGAPKQRAVLAALLVSADRAVSLDRLIDQLWGDEPPAAATASLQAYVANLRRVLEPDRPPRAPTTVLLTRAPGYVLRLGEGELDAAEFVSLLERGRRQLGEGDAHAAHGAFEAALALWRGPALQEFATYDFAAAEIARLGDALVAAREAHAEAALALGRHAQSVPQLEQLVAQHPWRERPRELLMLALYRCGRRADALEVMARTRRELADGLGIDPGPALQQLHAAILSHDSTLDWRPAALPIRVPSLGAAQPPTDERSRSRLVGRVKQLAVLREALQEAAAGRGRLALVVGEAGIGKTRLMQEIAADAEASGVDVAWGRCHDTESPPPFWPWVQALRALAATRLAEEVDRAVQAGGPALAPLLPELVTGRVAGPMPPDQARLLLYDAVATMLRALAADGPVLLLLEDLHWADRPSLELLGYLAGQLPDVPALVVGSYRDGADLDGPLAAMLATAAREPSSERLRLTGLHPEDIAEMISGRTGVLVDERTAAAVHERTDGNPFFITELTRLLNSEGRLDDPTTWPVPESVRDVLRRRVSRLPQQSAGLLAIGAVAGRSFELDVLQEVSGLDEDQVLDGVEAAVMTGLLLEHPALVGRYRFTHALVRETLYDGLSGIRRARLHARIGKALQQLPDANVDALAHHFWLAGPAAPAEETLAHVLAAADAAERALAYEQAVDLLQRALTLLPRIGSGAPDQEFAIQHRLGLLSVWTRGYGSPEAAAAFDRARALAVASARTVELAESLVGLANVRQIAADFAGATALGRELIDLGRASDDREIIRAGHYHLGMVTLSQGVYEAADDHFAEAVMLSDSPRESPLALSMTDPRVSSRGFRALTRWLLGDLSGASRLRAEALKIASGTGHAYTRAFGLLLAAHLAVYERDVDAVRRWAGEACTLCESREFRLVGSMCAIFLGWAEAMSGERGTERIAAGQRTVEATGTRVLRHFHLGLRAEAELMEGRPDEARRTLDEALAEVAATGDRLYEPALRRLRDRLDELHPS